MISPFFNPSNTATLWPLLILHEVLLLITAFTKFAETPCLLAHSLRVNPCFDMISLAFLLLSDVVLLIFSAPYKHELYKIATY